MKNLILLLIFGFSFIFSQTVIPLQSGVSQSSTLSLAQFNYYSIDSTVGISIDLSQTGAGAVYIFVGEDFIPTFAKFNYSLTTNAVQKHITTADLYEGTYFIAVYGYAASFYTIIGKYLKKKKLIYIFKKSGWQSICRIN